MMKFEKSLLLRIAILFSFTLNFGFRAPEPKRPTLPKISASESPEKRQEEQNRRQGFNEYTCRNQVYATALMCEPLFADPESNLLDADERQALKEIKSLGTKSLDAKSLKTKGTHQSCTVAAEKAEAAKIFHGEVIKQCEYSMEKCGAICDESLKNHQAKLSEYQAQKDEVRAKEEQYRIDSIEELSKRCLDSNKQLVANQAAFAQMLELELSARACKKASTSETSAAKGSVFLSEKEVLDFEDAQPGNAKDYDVLKDSSFAKKQNLLNKMSDDERQELAKKTLELWTPSQRQELEERAREVQRDIDSLKRGDAKISPEEYHRRLIAELESPDSQSRARGYEIAKRACEFHMKMGLLLGTQNQQTGVREPINLPPSQFCQLNK